MKTPNKIVSIAFAVAALGLSLATIQHVKGAGFVSVSPMNIARNYHIATLLPNGKVLVAGGFPGTSAELYDPATDTWTVTGSLRVARAGSPATLLPNGKVLVAGGTQSGGSLQSSASTELYDPATGRWTLTGSMKHARIGLSSTATLLPNGKVLVVGGDATGSSELYDPASGTWTLTGSASTGGRATLLPNGKVLRGAELYDPATGTWTPTGAPSTNRYVTATLLLNGKVLVASGNRTFTAELYDPASGTWSATGSLTWDRDFCTATLLRNGQVLIAGGYQQETDTPVASGEVYDPASGTWTEIPMNEPHFSHTATLLANGKVLIAGGNGWNVSLLSSAELYEPDPDGATPFMTILYNANQIMSFYWTGAGTLEQSDSLTTPNWQPAPIQDNPHIVSTTGAMKFFRVKAD
jgi:Kelch motif protein/galactose oxidase-like protein